MPRPDGSCICRVRSGKSGSLTLSAPMAPRSSPCYPDQLGAIDLYDLALEPGTYAIAIGAPSDTPSPYVLSAVPGPVRRPISSRMTCRTLPIRST